MSAFSAIDLSQLAPPDVVETLDYEAVLAAMKADLASYAPELAGALTLESDPLVKLLEICAYRETLLRARINDASRAVMLATSTGADLEHLAAFFGVSRQTVTEADPDADPPIAAVLETDARLRARTQLALEGYSAAGPVGAYVFHSMSASPLVKDVGISSPLPGQVLVTLLSASADGTADGALQIAVSNALSADDVRPLTDQVLVQSATITEYTIEASLTTYSGPSADTVLAAALAAAQTYADTHHRLGHDITLSGLFAALHQPGVQNVAITSPAADIVMGADAAAYCTDIILTHAGTDL